MVYSQTQQQYYNPKKTQDQLIIQTAATTLQPGNLHPDWFAVQDTSTTLKLTPRLVYDSGHCNNPKTNTRLVYDEDTAATLKLTPRLVYNLGHCDNPETDTRLVYDSGHCNNSKTDTRLVTYDEDTETALKLAPTLMKILQHYNPEAYPQTGFIV